MQNSPETDNNPMYRSDSLTVSEVLFRCLIKVVPNTWKIQSANDLERVFKWIPCTDAVKPVTNPQMWKSPLALLIK